MRFGDEAMVQWGWRAQSYASRDRLTNNESKHPTITFLIHFHYKSVSVVTEVDLIVSRFRCEGG
jgi:hypothetical protein